MALYSQRFWEKLSALDARANAALQRQREAYQRLATGRQTIVGMALHEFHLDLLESSGAARMALTQLQRFCGGRVAARRGTSIASLSFEE